MESWIQTYTGIAFNLQHPREIDVCIEDIAHALAFQCRFTGHSRRFYSVAQHSVCCAWAAPPAARLHALLHDAHEAYVGDMNSPLKHLIGGVYVRIADRIQRVINRKFGVELYPEEIHEIDRRMLLTEQRDLLGNQVKPWHVASSPYGRYIVADMHPGEAEMFFMKAFERIYHGKETGVFEGRFE